MKNFFLVCGLLICNTIGYTQSVELTGHVYDAEQDNRLDEVQINVYYADILLSNFTETDYQGKFIIQLPESGEYRLELIRPSYERQSFVMNTEGKIKMAIAIPMKRLDGYEFIGTIKKFLAQQDILAEEVKDVRVEIYNHMNGNEELDKVLTNKATFTFNFERGTRYSMLLRKGGFFAKRFSVLVDVEGCILCFEGLGTQFDPHILDDITQGNKKGVVTADIPIRPIVINEAIKLDNIYYDYDKWSIRSDARPALDKLVQLMRSTPIVIELGSHTDSRGKDDYNMGLSQKRAQSAVEYIIVKGISSTRISSQGYGESQPTNECVNDVTCSETKHQQNRRTEFKVTRLMSASNFDNKSLKEIIELERANKTKLLESFENKN